MVPKNKKEKFVWFWVSLGIFSSIFLTFLYTNYYHKDNNITKEKSSEFEEKNKNIINIPEIETTQNTKQPEIPEEKNQKNITENKSSELPPETKIPENKKEKIEKKKKVEKTIIISTNARGKHLGYFYAYENGKVVNHGLISAGRDHYETPVGDFPILEKHRYFTSKIYKSENGENNMDYMLRLTWGGIALHQGNPDQVSHGCIHISPKKSPWLFSWADENTKVHITSKEIDFDKTKDKNKILAETKEWNKEVQEERKKEETKVEYWPSGKVKSIRFYKGGYLDGLQIDFYENGKVKEHNYYQNGRWTGHRIHYWPNGQKQRDFYWKNDKLEKGKEWDQQGNLLSNFDIKDKY